MAFEGQLADVTSTWETISWRRVILGGSHSWIPHAKEALAEDTLGGGLVRSHGSGKSKTRIIT